MNKVFQVIYSEARNGYVIVSEFSRHYGRGRHERRLRRGQKLRVLISLLLATGGLAFQHEVSAEAFNGKPGTYVEFVDHEGDIVIPTGKSEYTFSKGAHLDGGSHAEEAISVNHGGQDLSIHVGKAEGKPYDLEITGYNRSFRNVNSGDVGVTTLTIDDTIDDKSTGADYHFMNDEKSRAIEGSDTIKTLFFNGDSISTIKGHSVTIDSKKNPDRENISNTKYDSFGILAYSIKNVAFDMTGDFKLDNEQQGIALKQWQNGEGKLSIGAKNIQITCNDPNEALSVYNPKENKNNTHGRIGVYAWGYLPETTANMTLKAAENLDISGYSTALKGVGYTNMELSGRNIHLDANPQDGTGKIGVYLNGASSDDSKVSLQSQDRLTITGGTGEEGRGIVDFGGRVDGQAKALTVSGSQFALYANGGGVINLTASNKADYQGDISAYRESEFHLSGNSNQVEGQVGAYDGSSIVFAGKDNPENGTFRMSSPDAPALVTGIEKEDEKHAPASITIKQNAIISNRTDTADTSYQDKEFTDVDSATLLAMTNGKITLNQAQGIYGNIMADVDPDDTSEVKSKGGMIQLDVVPGGEVKGNVSVGHSGTVAMNLNQSLWQGRATDQADADHKGTVNLSLSNGAHWQMMGDSNLTSLSNTSSLVDMKANDKYQTLNVGKFRGQDGTFLMKTDLDSQKDGDKVHIADAAVGSQGRVQVYDKSFVMGKEVTGVRNLLLITDKSKNAIFTGKSLDKGGIWDVTPTLQRGDTVKDAQGNIVGKDTEWYLTKIAKTVNHDTKPLIGASDYAYGLYRNDIEPLRQRMGELRFLKDKQDESGIWARMYGGEFAGPGYDSRYHAVQLGYDYAADPKSFYGFFGERGISSPHYDYGTGSNHSLAAGLYGTWFGDSGVYTDAVAKWGRDDANLHTFGPYPDQASYRTRAASLSLEYGKTMKLNDKGLFLEPQAQLVYGHLGSTHYTTAREKQVNMEGYDSFIGRVGFVFGRRTPDATKPLDYYLRLSALHEFGGRRDLHLSASDGETMDWSRDYGSTWYDASLGGTYRLNDRTTFYGDLQRSFGSDWHKKWQGNIGINWQF